MTFKNNILPHDNVDYVFHGPVDNAKILSVLINIVRK